jgi:signal transduction histidine kinase
MTESLRAGRESLIRSEKLASVGRRAAGGAHEVGNPLAAILGYVEMLLRETPDRPIDPSLQKDILGRVRTETERIHRIIQELLEYARPTVEDRVPVDVRRIVDAAHSLALASGRAKTVELRVDVAEGTTVSASAGRLTQVLLNLFLNAADAMGGNGVVTVDARRDGSRVVIGVTDDGPGVPADLRGKIFDPFFTTKDPGRGTGLGLSVSSAIVEGYGGTLRLVDAPRGARFELSLPADSA